MCGYLVKETCVESAKANDVYECRILRDQTGVLLLEGSHRILLQQHTCVLVVTYRRPTSRRPTDAGELSHTIRPTVQTPTCSR